MSLVDRKRAPGLPRDCMWEQTWDCWAIGIMSFWEMRTERQPSFQGAFACSRVPRSRAVLVFTIKTSQK